MALTAATSFRARAIPRGAVAARDHLWDARAQAASAGRAIDSCPGLNALTINTEVPALGKKV